MDPAKVSTIGEWASPTSVKGTQTLWGFDNFYQIFIQGYSEVVPPLTALTKNGRMFEWSRNAETACHALKATFTNTAFPCTLTPRNQ